MIRNLKTLGLALAAVFAMSVMAASAVQAAPTFTAESYPATGDSELDTVNTFTSQGRVVKCTTYTYVSTLAAASTTMTATPSYSGCTATVLGKTFPVTITMNGCDFLFHATNPSGPNPYLATADLVCTGSNDVVIHLYETAAKHTANEPSCTFTIKPQTGLEHVALTNGINAKTGKADVTAKVTAEKISTIVTGSEVTCGTTNATSKYEGSITLVGTTSGGTAQGISVSG